MDNVTIWEKTRELLKLDVSPTHLKMWFTETPILSIEKLGEDFKVALSCPNKFLTEQVEKKCGKFLIDALERVLGGPVTLDLRVVLAIVKESLPQETPPKPNGLTANGVSRFTNSYTFENFVVGESNKLAHSAALAVSVNPGAVYNPLFIYGGTGLGKTHLLHATAATLGQSFPTLKVAYKATESFINEFIDALAAGQVRSFRERYRRLDVLLVDDVHFLSGKPSTQDEFFHTFNELYAAHHQIVLTSDRHPQEIGRLEERLISRFLGGLTVDIAPYELELKMAILTKKARGLGLALDFEVCQLLASQVSSPREIEGVLATVIQSQQLGMVLNTQTVRSLLGKKQKPLRAAPRKIVAVVSKFYGVKSQDITGATRKREVVKARQMAMFLLRRELDLSFGFIGQILGARDHSTIIHGVESFAKELTESAGAREELFEVKRVLAL